MAQTGVIRGGGPVARRFEAAELVVLAIGAELAYFALVLIPLVPVVATTAAFYGPRIAAAFAVLFMVGAWWLIQEQATEPQGQPVPLDSRLARDIESLRRQADAPPIHRVVLDDSLNAAAFTSSGFLSLIGVRRTLILGLPLLRLLDVQEVRAVIAHELGHFSREHGRLGHWIYLVRFKWGHIVHEPREEGLHGFTQMLARAFVPFFLRRSSAWSVRCEYEADAVAARLAGGSSLASSLARIECLSSSVGREVQDRLRALCLHSPEPIDDYWGLVQDTAARADWRQHKPAHRSIYDTHPPLNERLRPLAEEPRAPDWLAVQPAGPVLLRDAWPEMEDRCRQRWKAKVRRTWRLDHVRLRSVSRRLESTIAPTARAMLEEQLAPSASTLQALRDASAEHPHEANLAFALGMALVRREEASGCDVLRTAARLDPRLAPRAAAAVATFRRLHGTDEEAERAARQAANARRALAPVLRGLFARVMETPRTATDVDRQALVESVEASGLVDAAWIVGTDVVAPTGLTWPVVILVLRIDVQAMLDAATSEELIAEDWMDLLWELLPPTAVARVSTTLTTEPLNPNLLVRLQSVDGSLLKAPRIALNEGVVKIDSL